MADQPTTAPPAGQKGGKGQKILGMPRTTGLIVIGVGALVVGYFVISHFSKSQGGRGKQQGKGGGGGGYFYGPGQPQTVRVIRQWQGHKPRPRPKQGGD